MIKYKFYLIETISNTHVGSGESNFGIVNNMIQRDESTNTPIFHASGIKGALRDALKESPDVDLNLLFGLEGDTSEGEKKKGSAGQVKFFDAQLLTLPLRSNRKIYFDSTSHFLLNEFFSLYNTFLPNNSDKVNEALKWFDEKKSFKENFINFYQDNKLEIEDFISDKKIASPNESINKMFNQQFKIHFENLAIFNSTLFNSICKNNLPVIARNKIGEDGTSENFFYEEVLPRRSRLWCAMGYPEKIEDNYLNFHKELCQASKLFQIGANSSVGYGLCKFTEILLED